MTARYINLHFTYLLTYWTRDATKTVQPSVPEVELCPGALLCDAVNMAAGITSVGT